MPATRNGCPSHNALGEKSVDRELRGFDRQRKEKLASTKDRHLKDRISNVLQVEKVAYGMEIARRIDVRIHRTIKEVLKTMFLDGELDRSDLESVDENIRVCFYWIPNTDAKTVRKLSKVKTQLLKEHMIISTLQKRFGPKLAIASLKCLAQSEDVPLNPTSIIGPLTKWNGLNDEWSEDPVVIPYGDIDVLALEDDNERLWIGEVKMRGDLLKSVQVTNFLASALRFRRRVFTDKGKDYKLKAFILTPLASVSARECCYRKNIELLECAKAYYPSETPKRGDISSFYKKYKKIMGFRNLEVVSRADVPLDELTELMRGLGEEVLPDTLL